MPQCGEAEHPPNYRRRVMLATVSAEAGSLKGLDGLRFAVDALPREGGTMREIATAAAL
jgi:hypothetical protein